MRRQVRRRAERKRHLREELAGVGLLPADPPGLDAIFAIDPAEILAKSAAGEMVEPYEVGRVIYWFASRRGFLSLRKGGAPVGGDEDDEAPVVDRRLRADQSDLLIAFWTEQAAHHPRLLTDTLLWGERGQVAYPVRPIKRSLALSTTQQFGVHGLVFFQRKVYWSEGTIGRCRLTGEPRALRADRISQRFRIWSLLSNLRFEEIPGSGLQWPTLKQKQAAFALLWSQKAVKFSRIKKVMGLPEGAVFTHEREGEDALQGNETDAALRAKSALGKGRLDALSDDACNELVNLLLGSSTDESLVEQLIGSCSLTRDEAECVSRVRFPQGRARYSRKAMRRLLPHLEEGFPLASSISEECAIGRAGFPLAGTVMPETAASIPADPSAIVAGLRPPETTNPVVRTTLRETALILGHLIREHGAIDVIRVETVRELGAGAKERQRIERDQRANQKARETARAFIEDQTGNANPARTEIRKVLLWREQGEECVYSGKAISVAQLLSDNLSEVDHILPRSRTYGDDRMVNLVLCITDENREKGNRTPYEWFGNSDPSRYEDILHRSKAMDLSWGKRQRLAKEELDADQELSYAHLVMTGHITSMVREWLHTATGAEVETTRGRQTAFLRHLWGLTKDQADHRRHALDAVCVALTSRKMIAAVGRRFAQLEKGKPRDEVQFKEPWSGFREELSSAYGQTIVSHRARRGVRGALHQETIYGKADAEGKRALRRPIEQINSPKRLKEVRDPAIREALADHLRTKGLDPEEFTSAASRPVFSSAQPPTMKSGVPIRSVRCLVSVPSAIDLGTAEAPRAVMLGNNHHAVIRCHPDGRMRIDIVSNFEVYRRRREGLALIDRMPDGDWKFAFSLQEGEAIRLNSETDPAFIGIFTVQSLDAANRRVMILPHALSASSAERVAAIRRYTQSAAALRRHQAVKVLLTPDGRVRQAAD